MSDLIFPNSSVTMTNSEKKILNYILQSPSDFLLLSIHDLSLRLGVSESTISRFSKHVGYSDFKELKTNIIIHLNQQDTPAKKLSQSLNKGDLTTVTGILHHQQQCIQKTIDYISETEIQSIISAMEKARKIYIYGKGGTSGLAMLLKFRLLRFGLQVELLPTGGSEIFESLNFITSDDFVIVFGFQKIAREAQVIFDLRKKKQFETLLFSSLLSNDITSISDYNLYVYRGEPTEYHSMCAPTALIDALVIQLATHLNDQATNTLEQLHQLKETYKKEIPR